MAPEQAPAGERVAWLWPFGLLVLVLVGSTQLAFPLVGPGDPSMVRERRFGAAVVALVAFAVALWTARAMARRGQPQRDFVLALASAALLGLALGAWARHEALAFSVHDFTLHFILLLVAMATFGAGLLVYVLAPGAAAMTALLVSLVALCVPLLRPRHRRAAALRVVTLGVCAGFAVALSFFATFLASQETAVAAALDRRDASLPAWATLAALAAAALLLRRARR